MKNYYLKISIRSRILGLLALALSLMMLTLLGVSIMGMSREKLAFILDFQLNQVKVAAESVDRQIASLQQFHEILKFKIRSNEELDHWIADHESALSLKKILILEVNNEGSMKVIKARGDEPSHLLLAAEQLGWDGLRLLSDLLLIGKASDSELVIGHMIKDSSGGGIAFLSWIQPALLVAESIPGLKLMIFNSLGEYLPQDNLFKGVAPKAWTHLLEDLLDQQVVFGVRDWEIPADSIKEEGVEETRFLLAYQHLRQEDVMVIGILPQDVAWASLRVLLVSLLLLGCGLLLLSFGVALLMLRQMTSGLQALLKAMVHIRNGDFSVRLDTRGLVQDEVGALTSSFNLMMVAIDKKLRDYQLQVVKDVHANLVRYMRAEHLVSTPHPFGSMTCQVGGLYAEPMGGDSWVFLEKPWGFFMALFEQADLNSFTALMNYTTLKAALNVLLSKIGNETIDRVQFESIIFEFDAWVQLNMNPKHSFSAFFVAVKEASGELDLLNLDFSIPRVFQKQGKKIELIPVTKYPGLGKVNASGLSKKEALATFRADSFQLLPGDIALWSSSGVFRLLSPTGSALGSVKLYEWLAELLEVHPDDLNLIQAGYQRKLLDFFGESVQPSSQDLTLWLMKRSNEQKTPQGS